MADLRSVPRAVADTFVCELCHETFKKEWTDEEATAESTAVFGELDPADLAVVCEDCWQRMGLGNA